MQFNALKAFLLRTLLGAMLCLCALSAKAQTSPFSEANKSSEAPIEAVKTYEKPATTPAEKVETPTDAGPTPKISYLLCRRETQVRTVRVTQKGSRCTATYTKAGVDEVVGNSSSQAKCYQVLNNIKINLEKGNWKCKDISESRVSLSSEKT